jgi:hypothetical protein
MKRRFIHATALQSRDETALQVAREVVLDRLNRSRRRRHVGEHPAAIPDFYVKFVALEENPVLVPAR